MAMRIRARFFASHREIVGRDSVAAEMPEGATAGQLLERLVSEHPGLKKLREHTVIAVNHEQVGPEHVLRDGDEVAFYPPVSGG
jgi:molybdopterin converting factor subunit 1